LQKDAKFSPLFTSTEAGVSTKKTDYLVEVSMTKSQKKLSVAQKLRKRALEKIYDGIYEWKKS